MKRRAYALNEVQRMVPLLRSIRREIRARLKTIDHLEERLEYAPRPKAGEAHAADDLRAELAVQRREVHSAERELERLGCKLDEQHPLRILIPSAVGHWAIEGPLDETRIGPGPVLHPG
jgi:hypothetical protein